MLFGNGSSHPVTGRVRLHIVQSSLKVKVMSKSVDLPHTPGDGYKLFHSGLVILAFLSCVCFVGSLSFMGRLVGEWSQAFPLKALDHRTLEASLAAGNCLLPPLIVDLLLRKPGTLVTQLFNTSRIF